MNREPANILFFRCYHAVGKLHQAMLASTGKSVIRTTISLLQANAYATSGCSFCRSSPELRRSTSVCSRYAAADSPASSQHLFVDVPARALQHDKPDGVVQQLHGVAERPRPAAQPVIATATGTEKGS
jgi:hypothetical protein